MSPALLPVLFLACKVPGKPGGGGGDQGDTADAPGTGTLLPRDTGDTGDLVEWAPPERDPTTVCEDLAVGYERVRLTSYHGRAWFWKPVPAHIDPDESGFMMGIQASTGPTDVCPDPMSWNWASYPEVPGELFIKLVWKMPHSNPRRWKGDYDWDPRLNHELGMVMDVQQGYLFSLGTYNAWKDRHTEYPMQWLGGVWDSHMCVIEVSPDRIRLQLLMEFYSTTAEAFGPGMLFLLDMHTDDGSTRTDGEPCFEIKSAIPEDELWGLGG